MTARPRRRAAKGLAAAPRPSPLVAVRRAPLYAQAEEMLAQRIAEGLWQPGAMLPPEPMLAEVLGVSPGTLRKAMAALERRRLIERRQGRGTFVAAETSERALFHFFRIVDLEGRKHAPTSYVLDCRTAPAAAEDAAALALAEGAALHQVRRGRAIAGSPCIVERIALPAWLFPGFALPVLREMTDELYVLYQRDFGITVARAEERLSAIAARGPDALLLGVAEGTPLIEIDRTAWDLAGRRVERRVTRLNTAAHRYLSALD